MVLQTKDCAVSVALGLWPSGGQEGVLFVANMTELDQAIETGRALGVDQCAATQTEVRAECGAVETIAWPDSADRCLCGVMLPQPAEPCKGCGAAVESKQRRPYGGRDQCLGGEEPDRAGDRGHGTASAPGPPAPGAAPASAQEGAEENSQEDVPKEEPEEHKEMFGLQDELLAAWRSSLG